MSLELPQEATEWYTGILRAADSKISNFRNNRRNLIAPGFLARLKEALEESSLDMERPNVGFEEQSSPVMLEDKHADKESGGKPTEQHHTTQSAPREMSEAQERPDWDEESPNDI